MPSKKANHYGTLAERKAAKKYGLDLARASWKDADRDGTPVEIKATQYRHADGQPGNFKLYHQYHRRLRRNSGEYVFVVYEISGRGINVLRSTLIHSSKLPRLSWHGGGEHRGTKQAKLAIGDVF